MSDMIERVARALHRAHYESGRRLYTDGAFELFDKFEREHWFFKARAAMEAMREPTEEMRAAIRDYYAPHFPNAPDLAENWVTAVVENHERMISAALK